MDFKKKLEELNKYVKAGNWNKKQTIKAELTSFETGHRVGRGRNGVSTLLDLRTRVFELDAVFVEKHKSGSLSLYLQHSVKETQGWSSKSQGVFVKIRKKSGKYDDRVLFENGDDNKTRLHSLLDYADLSEFDKQAFAQFSSDALADFKEQVSKVKSISEREELEEPSLRQLQRDFTLRIIEALVYPTMRGDTEKLEQVLEFLGAKLSRTFNFDEKIYLSPEYVNETKNGIEFGWESKETYNSLPLTLKLEKSTGVKTVSLSDLAIEGSGYYDHTDMMQILPEQVEKAKAFAKRFEANKSKRIERVLKKVA